MKDVDSWVWGKSNRGDRLVNKLLKVICRGGNIEFMMSAGLVNTVSCFSVQIPHNCRVYKAPSLNDWSRFMSTHGPSMYMVATQDQLWNSLTFPWPFPDKPSIFPDGNNEILIALLEKNKKFSGKNNNNIRCTHKEGLTL